jgi:hypothetical protein
MRFTILFFYFILEGSKVEKGRVVTDRLQRDAGRCKALLKGDEHGPGTAQRISLRRKTALTYREASKVVPRS